MPFSTPLGLLFVFSWSTSSFSQVTHNPHPNTAWNSRVSVFFNGTIDSSYALPGNTANALENLEQRVIDAINVARGSIDVAAYELNSLNIIVALCKAKERGVRVRIIVDDKAAPNANGELWKIGRRLLEDRYGVRWITDAGWPWVKSKGGQYKGHRAQMHHKFMVIDRITPDGDDDLVLTGSYNYTITGMVSMQNLVMIRNWTIAGAFEEEFEQMWGSSSDVPDSSRAAFHQNKRNLPVRGIRNGKSSIDVYFAPVSLESKGRNFLEIIAGLVLTEANHDIKISAFSFSTGIEIDGAIRQKYESSGVDVKAVFEPSLARPSWSLYRAMTGHPSSQAAWKKHPDARLANEDRHLHHKYILIDAENPDTSDVPVLVTGSLNFSRNANDENDENFLIVKDRSLVNQYLQEFYARFKRARRDSLETNGNDNEDDRID